MSHPFHNPYPFGNQSSTQQQNVLGTSGASSVTSDISLGTIPSRHAFPVSYAPPQGRTITDEDMERSTEIRIGQPREEMRHQPVDQGPCFTSTPRDKFISSTARVTSSPVCSSSQRHSDFKSGTGSLDWPSYNKPTEDDSSRFFSSASLSFLNSGGNVFNASSERERDMQSIPGLGDYDYRLQDKPVVPSDSSYPKYTSQEASNILLRFGLEKEDLEYLISYPEDQITPGNLPFILRQIRMKKAENVNTTIHSKPCPEPQSTTSMTGIDRFSSLRGEGTHQDKLSPIIKPSKVIDYGHTNKYTGGFGDEIRRSSGSRANSGGSGSMSLMDSYDGSSHNRETLQKSTTEVKTSALVSSHDQRGTVSSNSAMQTYVPPSSRTPTQRMQTQPSQASQEITSSFSLPKKDTDLRPLKSKPAPLKESEPDCHLALETKPPPSLVHGMHPDRPGLVLIGSSDDSCTKNKSKSKGQGPEAAEQINKQKMHPKQMQQELKKQTEPQQQQQAQKRPGILMRKNQPTIPAPPALPQIIREPVNFAYVPLQPSSKQCFADGELSKGLPTLAMMQDYAAATPQTFPHTCSLCLKKFTCMKDWLLHQNTSLHLDNCKLLRKRYPQWDGNVLSLPSASGTEKKPLPSTSGKTSQRRHLKTRHPSRSRSRSRSPRRRLCSDGKRPKRGGYSCSRSNSPHLYYRPDGRKEKFGSGSQSPHGSRHTRRSRSRSFSPRHDRLTSFHYRSRSRSHERRSSPRRRDEKQPVPKRSDERRFLPRRRDDKGLPPNRSLKKPSSEERSFAQQKKLDSSTERLAKQLLETPALQSLSKQSDLEAMAKTLAPVLLAELAKMKSPLSSSASASSSSSKKEKTNKSSEAKPRLQKSEASSSSKLKSTKPVASTTVRLQGIPKTCSHEDVVAALEHFGKPESVVLYRSKLEAKVNFVKEEAAQELKKLKNINIKGTAVTVVREQDTVSKKPLLTFTKQQGKPPQKKTAKSSMSTSLSTKSTVAGKSIKKPPSLPSGDKKPTAGKLVTKAKALVSKAKSVSTKQISKTFKKGNVAAKRAVKLVEEKKGASKVKGCNNSKSSGKQQDPGILKQRTIKSGAKNSTVASKNTVKVDELSNKTAELIKGNAPDTRAKVLVTQVQPTSTVDKSQTQLGKFAVAGTATKENEKEATAKGRNVTSKSAPSENKPDVETLKIPKTEIKVHQSAVVSDDQAKVPEAKKATGSEIKKQAEFVKFHGKEKQDKHTEQLESVNTKVAEPMEVESSPQSKKEKCSDRKALMTKSTESQPPASIADISPLKVPADPSQRPQTAVKTSETLFKVSSQIHESAVLEPDFTTRGQTPQQTAGSSTEAALESKQTAERVENIKQQKGLLETIQATNVPSKSTASEDKPDAEAFKTPKIDTKVKESVVTPEDGAKVPETRNVLASKMTQQAELAMVDIKTKEASRTEPLESGNTKVTAPTEAECSTDRTALLSDEGHTPTSKTETTLDASPTKLLIEPPQRPQTTNKNTEPLEDTEVQESGKVPESATKVPETKNVSACETKQQVELLKVETKESKHIEPLESGNTKVTEPTKVEHSTNKTPLLTKSSEHQTPSITGTTPGVSLAKLSHQRSQTTVKKMEALENTEVRESGSVDDDVEEKEAKHAKSLECGKTQVAEPMEVEHPDKKKSLLTKSSDSQTPTSAAETTPDISPTTNPPQRPQTIVTKTETLAVQESAAVPENTTKVLETRNATTSEMCRQTESAKAETETKYTGEVESANTKLAEPMADQSSDNGEKLPCRKDLLIKSSESQPSNNKAETTLDVSLPKSSTDPLKTPQTTMKRPVSSQIQQSITPGPESTTAQGQIQQQTPGSSAEVALEAKQTVQSVKTIAQQKDPLTAVATRKDPPSKTVCKISAVLSEVDASAKTKPTVAAEDQRQPMATVSSTVAFSNLAIGEKIEKLMHKDSLSFLKKSKTQPSKVISITNLPEYHNSCYTEADVADLLSPFGFQYLDHNIYVIPQMRSAFAIMPSLKKVENLIKASNEKSIILNGCTLCVEAIISPFPMNPLGFYSSLMKLVHYQVTDDRSAMIFIKRISPSEAGDLSKALKKIGSVKNCLPLLSKMFIEFESIYDADRLGVWYSLLKRGFGHTVCRSKVPQNDLTSRPPRLAAKALPDSKDVAEGATIPTTNFGVPQGSTSPFWVTMKTFPFLFPTASPWFIIPDFLTVKWIKIKKTHHQGPVFPHVMFTNLPEGNYRHEDIAKLVWRYFPVHNHHTLNYNIIVLSLQRRAFVYFSSWNACTNFINDHIKNPVSVGGRVLDVHYVLQDMHPGSSEEIRYRNLMKWSNAHVTELESLEERLLCMEISETSVDLIMTVMKVVASKAAFVGFLPLANRIYIEMAESSGVTQVLENMASVDYLSTHVIWSKVRRIETLKSLKQHLQDSSNITVNLELDTKPPAVMSGAQPTTSDKGTKTLQRANSSGSAAQPIVSAGSAISDSLTAGQGAIATSDVGMKETCDKPGTEITKTSAIAHQTSQDVEKAEGRKEGSPATSATSADGRTVPAACSSAPPVTSLVTSKENIKKLPIVKAHEPRLIQGTDSRLHKDKKSPSSSITTSRSELNEETIQEKTCRMGGEKQSQVVSPAAKQISSRSLKDSKNSSSSSVSQTSISSSLESIETPSLPSEKAQTNKPESPEIASHTPSSDFRTCSSKMASTAAVGVAVETHQLHREDAKPTESAMGKSGHNVSTESIITETKIETSLEMQSTAQGQELESTSQTQIQEMDFNNGILGKLKESTGKEWEKDNSDKYPEEEDYEDYQILDSIDDQMDEHEHQDGTETKLSDPAHEPWDTHRVFDSVTEDQAAIVKQDYQEAAANMYNVLDTSKNQTPRSREGQRTIQKQEEMQRSFKASKGTSQIPHDEKQPLEDQDPKDVSADADGAEEEAFEILDSIEDNTDDHVSSDTHLFDDQNFNFEDFITVDEIEDDTEDAAFSHQSSSSSEQNSRSTIEGQSLDVSSSGKQTLNTSCQDSNISASHFSSLSSSSKPADVTVKGSLPPSVSKTSATFSSKSVEAHASPGQKTQPNKLKSPVRALLTSFSDCRTHSLKMASSAAFETSADTHKLYKESKTAESAVVKCAHKVSTKGTAIKTAESESRQSPGPEKGQRLHEGAHQVTDSVTDKVKACPEECSEIGLDASLQELGSVTKDQVAPVQEDSHLVEDEDSTEKKMVEENKIQVIENSDKPAVQHAADKNEVSHTSRNKIRAQREERRIKGKEEMLPEESCKASKDAGQITSDKHQSSDDRDVKDNSSHGTDEEAFEILDSTDDHASSNTHSFDRQSFNLEDFVTVDEIVDDVEEVAFANQSTSASKRNSRRKRQRQGSDVLSSVKQTSTRFLKDSKSSATNCSFSPSSSKPMKATVKSSLSMAMETRASSVEKAPSSKLKSSARALHTSSSGCRTSSSKIASTAAGSSVETYQPNKEQAKSAESSVVKSDHKVSAEGIALKTVESESSRSPGPEQSQKFHGGNYKVLDSIEDEGSEESSEMEMDVSVKALDSVTEDQTATVQEATKMVEDEGSTLKQLSDEHVIQVVDNSDKSTGEDAADKNEVLDTGNNQTSRSRGDGMRGKEKEDEMLSDETCKDSGQMTNINHQNSTEASPDGAVQEAFEILDSADDHTDDQVASEIHPFDEQNFNLENFVTVDEIVDDTEDDQSSDVLSSAKRTSLRSSKDSESAWSPSLSKPTKSTVKNSLSSCVRKTTATSSSKSEIPASSGQKGLSNKSNFLARASYTSSSGSRTRSSKLVSTTAHEATIETHQLRREDANPTKSAIVKSVHKVSAKSITAQNDESESKQSSGAEKDQRLHEEGFQVLDSIKDDDKFCSEECSETGLDASLKVLDSDAQDQITRVQEDKLLVKDESSTVKQLSEKDFIQVVDNSDIYAIEHAAVEKKGLDESRNQPRKCSGEGSKGEDKEKFSEESSKPTKDAVQIPVDKDQPLEDGDNKATLTEDTEQEAFEVVDSTDDHTHDEVASDTHLFDEQNFNLESFVTVDEIVEEMGETAFDHQRSSSSQQTTRRKRKRQSSAMSSCAKHFSTRSSKDSKSQAALSFISKPTKDSVQSTLPSSSTSMPLKKQKDSSQRTKFNTRPFASPRASKTPLSSSPLSIKTQASPGRKAKLHKTESPARSPHTLPSGCRTHLSKMASTADAEVSVKTQHSHREKEKPTENAAAKSDHNVSTEGITADTKIKTSPEMHPPAQGEHGRKTESLTSDKDERNGKGNDSEKHIEVEEEEDDSETYQIIDSVDDQTEEQLDEEGNHDGSAKSKSPEPEQCQKLHEGSYQILGFAEDKCTIQNNKNQDIQGTTMDAAEAFEILDSVDDLTEKEDDCQKLEPLSNQVSKGDTGATEEEEEAYEVIDSVEDEPTTAETELEADNKEQRTEKYDEAKRVDRPARRSGPRTRTSKSEENWKSPMKGDKPVKKYQIRTKKGTMEKNKNILKDTEEVIQVNVYEDESIKDTSTPERSGRKTSVRGNTLACREASGKPHGAETDNSNPVITARSTSGRREKTAKEVSTKDKTSTRSSTTTRDPQERNLEKTEKNEEKALLNKRPPTKKSDALVKDLSEKEASYEILHPVKDDDVKDDQPATSENAGLERPKKYFEKTFLDDTSELVTLDEVGADEGGDEGVLEGEEWNREITEDELQEFVTLDEIVEDEEEGKEVCPLSRSVQSSNRETSANVKEAVDDEKEAREGAEKISRSAKRKHDDSTEEDGNFGRDEGEEKEAATTRTSGRATKRTRQNPVRTSVRGKKGATRHEREEDVEIEARPPASLQASSSLDKKSPALSSDGTPATQKTEAKAGGQPNVNTASAGEQPEAECPTHEGRSRTDVKAVSKRRRELIKPEAKRPRSRSPCVTDDLDSHTSLGEEHMVPKMGLFCNLCSIFYLDEQNAKDLHCRSQKHQENLKKHQQKLQSRPSRMSTRNSRGSVLD